MPAGGAKPCASPSRAITSSRTCTSRRSLSIYQRSTPAYPSSWCRAAAIANCGPITKVTTSRASSTSAASRRSCSTIASRARPIPRTPSTAMRSTTSSARFAPCGRAPEWSADHAEDRRHGLLGRRAARVAGADALRCAAMPRHGSDRSRFVEAGFRGAGVSRRLARSQIRCDHAADVAAERQRRPARHHHRPHAASS